MACIYYIKNNISGKIYIGQTCNKLDTRIKQHMHGKTEIDLDIIRLGIENFTYGVVEYCAIEDLDRKEIEYIAEYDSYYNGYNNTLGGKHKEDKYSYLYNNIISDYIGGMSMVDINIKYKISSNIIRYFVRNISRDSNYMLKTNISKEIICYSKDWVRICSFTSIREAMDFVNCSRDNPIDSRNFYRIIKTACCKNGIACGYRW